MLRTSAALFELMLLRVIGSLRSGASRAEPEPQPIVAWPKDCARVPEVRSLIREACQLQAQGDLAAAALRVNRLVTLSPGDDTFSLWLGNLRRRIDAEIDEKWATREANAQTVMLPEETVRRIVELSRGRTPRPVESPLEGSLMGLDDVERGESSMAIDDEGIYNSLRGLRRGA